MGKERVMRQIKCLLLLILITNVMFLSIPILGGSHGFGENPSPSETASKDSSPTDVASNYALDTELMGQTPLSTTSDSADSALTPSGEWSLDNANEWNDIAGARNGSIELIVGVDKAQPNSFFRLTNLIASYGGKIVNRVWIGSDLAVVVDISLMSVPEFTAKTKASGLSRYIEPNKKFQIDLTPNDPSWNRQWGPVNIEADRAWDTQLGSRDILVAVIDTGIEWNHPDLAANYVPLGYDWVNNDPDPMDDHGHGTHVAGIIAAVLNNWIGIAGLAQVSIMAEKGINQYGWGEVDDLANAIVHAVNQSAKILNLSWGGYFDSSLIHEAITYAYDAGVLVIAAAGNDATSIKHYPAAYEEVVSVAATDMSNATAWFSNFGSWIELAAPGVYIYSTYWDDTYTYLSGTSMAAPHVVGVAALIWSQFPKMTRDQVRIYLRQTADDLGERGFDVHYGYGRVNARKGVEQSLPDHDLMILRWRKPPYVEPMSSAFVNATVFNYGMSDESSIEVQLFVNSSVAYSTLINFLQSGATETVTFKWTPTIEGIYNVTSYIVPVSGETIVENNVVSGYVHVGYPLKAFVLDSAGTDLDTTAWETLNTEWRTFGNRLVYIDYTTLNKENITYADMSATDADVLIISCAYAWEFTDEEIDAIKQYVHEGHGLIATAGTLYYGVPNNNKLAPLFGLSETVSWTATWTDLLDLLDPSHPLFANVPDPYTMPMVGTALPSDYGWDISELNGGAYLALGAFQESAIVEYKGLVYISTWPEIIPPYYHFNLQLLYNAIVWSRYQRPEHELTVSLSAPPYVKPGESTLLNATVVNEGLSDESHVKLKLLINDTLVESVTRLNLVSGSSYTLSFQWTPDSQGTYNVTAYVPPKRGETSTANNDDWAYVSVGFPVKAVVLDSAGTDYDEIIDNWRALNKNWRDYGNRLIYIDYTTLNKEDITYDDIRATDADVLIISCAYAWEFTDSEIEAVTRYVLQGHGLIATAGTLYYGVPNNNKLAPLFGLNETTFWGVTGTDLLDILNPKHPLFVYVPDPYTMPYYQTVIPYDGAWDSNELAGGTYEALGYYRESAIVSYRGLVYISPWLEVMPSRYRFNLQLLYNAIVWSRYQRPEHELAVSLDAPPFLRPGQSAFLNATVFNIGLNNESNVELRLYIDGILVDSTTISELLIDASHTISYSWSPTIESLYNVTAFAPPLPAEETVKNNVDSALIFVRFARFVLWDDLHDADGDSLMGNYLSLYQLLNASGFVVHELTTGTINSQVLALADILVVVDPEYDFTPSEISDIHDWMATGGAILFIVDSGYPRTIDTLMAPYGIRMTGRDTGWGFTSNIVPHPITRGVMSIYYDRAWEIEVKSPSEVLAWTSEESCAFLSAMIGAEVVVVSDSNIMDNWGLEMGFNRQLMLNIFNWIGIKYEHELLVALETPDFAEPGESVLLNATVLNRGINNETNVEFYLLINNTEVKSTTISELLSGSSYTMNYLWKPMVEASFNVTAYAPPVIGESSIEDNVLTKFVYVRLVKGRVLFDQTHKTDPLTQYGVWISDLIYRGYIVHSHMSGAITPAVLTGYNVFVILEAYYSYTSDELSAIEGFVRDGGGLLVVGDDVLSLMTEITDFAGINWVLGGGFGSTSNITPHEVTAGVQLVYLLDPRAHLNVVGGALDLVRDTLGEIALAVSSINRGRVIGFVDEDSLRDYGVVYADNLKLANNMIDWLAVRYEHELEVSLEAPSWVSPEEFALLNATVYNLGISNETGVELQLLINGTTVLSTLIDFLESGALYKVIYKWEPTVEATYNVTAYVPPLLNEVMISNNVESALVTVARLPIVYVNPAVSRAALGEPFTIDVAIANISELFGYQFQLSFDPGVLKCLGVALGDFFPPFPRSFTVIQVNNTIGFILFAAVLMPPETAKSGSGTLATVTFNVTTSGSSLLDLYDTKLGDIEAKPIAHETIDGYFESTQLRTFPILVGGTTFNVSTVSNSSITSFEFNQSEGTWEISFYVGGSEGTSGFFNLTVPNSLMWGIFTVYVDGIPASYVRTDNTTHTSLYFSYHHSTLKVQILSTEGVAEFSTWILIIPMLSLLLLGVHTLKKRLKTRRNPR